MLIESYFKNGYQVLRIAENLTLTSELSAVVQLVKECVDKGIVKIALSLTPKSTLYTPSIRTLVQSYRIISERGGRLAVIAQDETVRDALDTCGLASVIQVLESEDEISGPEPSGPGRS